MKSFSATDYKGSEVKGTVVYEDDAESFCLVDEDCFPNDRTLWLVDKLDDVGVSLDAEQVRELLPHLQRWANPDPGTQVTGGPQITTVPEPGPASPSDESADSLAADIFQQITCGDIWHHNNDPSPCPDCGMQRPAAADSPTPSEYELPDGLTSEMCREAIDDCLAENPKVPAPSESEEEVAREAARKILDSPEWRGIGNVLNGIAAMIAPILHAHSAALTRERAAVSKELDSFVSKSYTSLHEAIEDMRSLRDRVQQASE